MIGLQIERVLKMIHKDVDIIIKTESGKVFYEGKRGGIFNTKLFNRNKKNDLIRLQIKHIEIGDNDTFIIILYDDKYEEKHYSKNYYDDEFRAMAMQKHHGMFDRVKNPRSECYEDVTICEEWKDFETFYEWLKDNWVDCDERVDLDKDLLGKNNKIYSPQTCCLIPHSLNVSIRIPNKQEARGIANWDEKRQAYKIRIDVGKYHINTQRRKYKDAMDLYFVKKDEFVKALAEDYRDIILPSVYEQFMQYNSRELYLEKFGDFPKEYYED